MDNYRNLIKSQELLFKRIRELCDVKCELEAKKRRVEEKEKELLEKERNLIERLQRGASIPQVNAPVVELETSISQIPPLAEQLDANSQQVDAAFFTLRICLYCKEDMTRMSDSNFKQHQRAVLKEK